VKPYRTRIEDVPLAEGVAAWLEAGWPLEHVHYAGRPALSR